MAMNPARQLTPAERDRLVREMSKNLPVLAPIDLFASFVSDPGLMINQNASQQAQIADIAARQLIVAKAVSELAKQIQDLRQPAAVVTPPPV